jgi:hypothetical protein
MKKLFLSCFMTLATSTASLADDHPIGKITSHGMDLIWSDHTLTGTIDGVAIFADNLPNEFGTRLLAHIGGQTFEGIFKGDSGVMQGSLTTQRDNQQVNSTFTVTDIDGATATISGKIDDDEFTITMSSNQMNGHHFVNPLYTLNIGAEQYQFRMDNGEVCLGCTSKIAFVILTVKRNMRIW